MDVYLWGSWTEKITCGGFFSCQAANCVRVLGHSLQPDRRRLDQSVSSAIGPIRCRRYPIIPRHSRSIPIKKPTIETNIFMLTKARYAKHISGLTWRLLLFFFFTVFIGRSQNNFNNNWFDYCSDITYINIFYVFSPLDKLKLHYSNATLQWWKISIIHFYFMLLYICTLLRLRGKCWTLSDSCSYKLLCRSSFHIDALIVTD